MSSGDVKQKLIDTGDVNQTQKKSDIGRPKNRKKKGGRKS